LQRGYELGRRAIGDGIGILDMAAIHHQALLDAPVAEPLDTRVIKGAEFFAECLTSFEMSLRGYQEANEKLLRANNELETRNADISRVSRAKSDFLAMMSHELRTPLNSIIGFSEVLLDSKFGPLNDRQTRYLGNVHHSARHLLGLINELLDLSKIEAGRLEIVPRPFSSRLVTLEALATVKPLAHVKAITLDFAQAEDESLPLVLADEVRFKQVLYNLLSNAIKFTPNGGRVAVAITRAPVAGLLRTSISDTGPGIAPAELDRLFKPFSQLDNARTVTNPGTGLGLALSKQLAELMGGTVGVQAVAGQGARFFIDLPIDGVR
jgi:signal transduction histidine kinase